MSLYPRHTDSLQAMHAKHFFEVERALLSIIISPLKALMKHQVCLCMLKKVCQSCKTLHVASGLSGAIGDVHVILM